jgi:ribosomal-protein-alanine N-acetyltransferase
MYFFRQPFPVLDLGDIILREITPADAPAYFTYMNQPGMRPYLTEFTLPSSLEQAIDEVKYWSSLFHLQRSIYWAISLKNNQLIGTAGFNNISVAHHRGEISYDLDPNYWGRGIMLKAIKNILHFTDYNIKLIRVQATAITDNERSIKVLQRCGFAEEGLLKKYEMVAGEYKDYYLYARVLD